MLKWYEQTADSQDILVASRIRLSRNFREYPFPCRQSEEQQKQLLEQLLGNGPKLEEVTGIPFEECDLSEFGNTHKKALEERNLIHKAAMKKESPTGILVSADESYSILLECDDHIRMQVSGCGLKLEELWEKIDKVDDYFSLQKEYAFDDTLGYLTTFPNNVGTGMKAYVIMHLPFLCSSEKVRSLFLEMGRYGVNVRGGFGNLDDNPGNLIILYNQKTLGVSEEEIIQILNKVAIHIRHQEERARRYRVEHYRLQMQDQVYKSYGILKCAVLLTLEEALEHLSNLQWGLSCGFLRSEKSFNGYQLMLEIQSANLQVIHDRPMEDQILCKARAEYIQKRLPQVTTQ